MARENVNISLYRLRGGADAQVERDLFANSYPLENGLDGRFLVLPSQEQTPRWFRTIRNHIASGDKLSVLSQSAAALMLVRHSSATYVISFGYAWQYLELKWLELDFGRRVVLNSVPRNKIIEVSSQQIFAKKHLSRERAPRATDVAEFGLEYDRDLVAALEGSPSEQVFGKTIRGSVSLRLSIHFPSMPDVLSRVAVHFASIAYKRRWPGIDNVSPISEDALITQLDSLLDADIISGKARAEAALFTPAFMRGDISQADSCAIGTHSSGQARSPYLLYSSWESFLGKKKKAPSLAEAKATPVHLFDETDERIERRSVYECLTHEVTHQRKQYVLSSGIWHHADADFMEQVEDFLRTIKSSPVKLPAWNGTDKEGKYNLDCCRKGDMLHFDAKNIHFGGKQSKFEFCDFMHPTEKMLFFVKIASKASGCSHLVEQVRRTDELLFGQDGTFRARLKKVFEKHHPKAKRNWLDEKPSRTDWKLCLVSMGRDKMDLPFFAKCSVRRLVRGLQELGHSVFFTAV
jgi:uncharacterized protein (TIGR04141 family)